ncbi:MAG: ABC transporter substrate-binding protein [Pseudomonadota bacterium]|nr:ABC transporter substrate-binding protein [Pseudomonadota bacterium]
MFRGHFLAMLMTCLAFAALPATVATADDRQAAAGALIDQMIADLEAFLATDTGDIEARSAEIDRVLSTYFDMESITRFSAGQYWRAADADQKAAYGSLFREVLCGTIVRNFDQLNGLAYTPAATSAKGDKFVIVGGTFTDTAGTRPPVAVNWRVLTREGKPPRVFDIEIENLSLLVTQKQENVAVIRKNKGQFSALIEAMKARLEQPLHNN